MMQFIYEVALFATKALLIFAVIFFVLLSLQFILKSIKQFHGNSDEDTMRLDDYSSLVEKNQRQFSDMVFGKEFALHIQKVKEIEEKRLAKQQTKKIKEQIKQLKKKGKIEPVVVQQNKDSVVTTQEKTAENNVTSTQEVETVKDDATINAESSAKAENTVKTEATAPTEQTDKAEAQPNNLLMAHDQEHAGLFFTESRSVMIIYEFNGSTDAKEVRNLKRVVNLLVENNSKGDEFVLKLQSPGGSVCGYGLCAAELERVKKAGIKLTIAVDEVAASGGYMMACVADKILAAPFAYIGSIGVVAEFPNFNRLLKRFDVDYEQVTAGEFKRTLTQFGENTEEARKKFKEELERIHKHFKDHVVAHRPKVDIEKIATGECWLAKDALDLGLVDDMLTSDEYITKQMSKFDKTVRIRFESNAKKSLLSVLRSKEDASDLIAAVIDKLNRKNKV